MAELVGLVSAIAALTTLGFKLANGISAVAEELGTAGSQLKCVAADTKAFALVLHELKKHLKNVKRMTKQALEVAHEIVAQCQVDIEDLNSYIAPFLSRGEDQWDLAWMKRVKWLFAKSKLTTRRAALDSLKLTLSLFIAGLGFMDGDHTEEYMQTELKEMVAKCKNTKSIFLEAERYDRALEAAFSAQSANEEHHHLEGSVEENCSVSETLNSDAESARETAVLELSTLHIVSEHGAKKDGPPMANFQVIESLSDDQFMKIGEHIRIQRITSNFSLMALNQGSSPARGDDPTESINSYTFNPARRPGPRISTATNSADELATSGSIYSGGSSSPVNTEAFDNSAHAPRNDADDELSDTTTVSSHPGRGTGQSSTSSGTTQSRSNVKSGRRSYRSTRSTGSSQQAGGVGDGPATGSPPSHTSQNGTYQSQPQGFYRPQGFYQPQYDYMPYQGNIHPSNYGGRPPMDFPYQTNQQYNKQFMTSQSSMPSKPKPPPQPDPEKMRLEAELKAFKAAQEQAKAAERQRELETRIRRDAEEAFTRRMEDLRNAQEDAKREISKAKAEAELAARERIEAEQKAEEERRLAFEEAQKTIAQDVEARLREEYNAKMEVEKKKSKGLRKYFS